MIRALALLALIGLAACGADGEPVQPETSVGIGIGLNSGGIHVGGTVGVTRGPLEVGVSVF